LAILLRVLQWTIVSQVLFCSVTQEYSSFTVNTHTQGNGTMKTSSLLLAALSAVTMMAAHAENPDPSGQFAATVAAPTSRTQVRAELAAYQKSGVNPWSWTYNPLATFQGERSRAEVRDDYLAHRDEVSAMTGEDSGSAYLSAQQGRSEPRHLAGQPVNPQ
jgi:hypothetical protein